MPSKIEQKAKPLDNKILVRRDKPEDMKSGIYLPEASKDKPQEATVIAVGPGKMRDDGERTPVAVNVTDRVLLSKWGGVQIDPDDEDLLIVEETDILAVIE